MNRRQMSDEIYELRREMAVLKQGITIGGATGLMVPGVDCAGNQAEKWSVIAGQFVPMRMEIPTDVALALVLEEMGKEIVYCRGDAKFKLRDNPNCAKRSMTHD